MTLQDVFAKCQNTADWEGQPVVAVSQRNFVNDTPLHTACTWGELEPVEILIANGADVRTQGEKGCSVLFSAIIGENADVVRLMLAAGANVSIRNEWGRTALEYAVNMSASKVIIDLLKKTSRTK